MVEQVEGSVARAASAAAPAQPRAAPVARPRPRLRLPLELSRVRISQRTLAWGGLGLALALGIVARLPHVLGSDFPTNDGGMFYGMVRDLQASHYILPSHTTYNGASIPYAYPPLAFYLAGLLDTLTPASLTDVMRFLPLTASVLTIVAVYFVARALFHARTPAPELAAIIFALLPRGYRWLVVGGGLTRSLGLLFALLAVYELYMLYTKRRTSPLPAIGWSTLTVLSHPEMSWYLAFTMTPLLACYGRSRAALIDTVRVVGTVGFLTMPWWLTVLVHNGPAPFLSAAQTGGHSSYVWHDFLFWNFTEISTLNWPAVLAVLGAVACIAGGELFLPIWLVTSMVLEPRSGPTYISVPIALLCAVAITKFVLPLASNVRLAPGDGIATERATADGRWAAVLSIWERGSLTFRRALPACAVALFLFYIGFLGLREVIQPDPLLVSLSHGDRKAMAWVNENTPKDSTFVIVSGDFNPFTDEVSEWFPAMTNRRSVATLQGYEWLGQSRYFEQWDNFWYLQACDDSYCLNSWMARTKSPADYVYVTRDCCPALEQSLARSTSRYSLAYSTDTAIIYKRLPAS